MTQIGQGLTLMKNGVQDFAIYVNQERTGFGDMVASKLAEHQNKMEVIVGGCTQKFDEMQASIA